MITVSAQPPLPSLPPLPLFSLQSPTSSCFSACPPSSILPCALYLPLRRDGASVAVRFLWAFSSGWAPQGSPCCHYLSLMSRHYGSTPSTVTAAPCRNHRGALPLGNTPILLRVVQRKTSITLNYEMKLTYCWDCNITKYNLHTIAQFQNIKDHFLRHQRCAPDVKASSLCCILHGDWEGHNAVLI